MLRRQIAEALQKDPSPALTCLDLGGNNLRPARRVSTATRDWGTHLLPFANDCKW